MHDVFISYSHKDKSVADAICANLEANSVRCWYAPRDITSGEEWADAIMDALSKAKVFVLIFSKHSNLSPQVKNEITSAVSYGCKIIPFCIDSVEMNKGIAYYLNSVHWLDATGKIEEETMKTLYEEVYAALYNKKADIFVPVPFKIKGRTKFKFLFLGIFTAFLVALLALVGIYLSGSPKTETYSAEVGDIVTFGTLEGQPIEWRVIDKDGNRALIISNEGLYSDFYNLNGGLCTWESCSLRRDLNGKYYDLWFTEEEKSNIHLTHLENPGNEEFGTEGGNSTRDYIFILSLEEVLKYFPVQESRKIKMAGYARYGNSTYFAWWLRNPGRDLNSALFVFYDGGVDYSLEVDMEFGEGTALQGYFAVRPAMWVENEFTVKEASSDKGGKINEGELKNAKQGDTVKFGSYEQDNDTSNGAEEIEWIVLDTEEYGSAKSLTLISRYCLDEINITSQNYGYDYWYSSVARDWLNNDFYRTAFNEEQRELMSSITVTTTEYGDNAGKEVKTVDPVVFLSLEEYNRYSHIDGVSTLIATDYLLEKNSFADSWWLRDIEESAYFDFNYAVSANGEITTSMQKFASYVRPVIKISVETK